MKAALAAGIAPETILKEGLIAAMGEVGRLFEENEYFVPEMLVAARAMQGGLAILKPHLAAGGTTPAGKVVIGTVKGDLHDIGKNLVAMMLEGAGFEVVDLGTDVTPEKFVEAVIEHKPNGSARIGMSALLTTTMPSMSNTIKALQEAGVARPGQGDDRRRAGDRRLCQADRRRRLQPGRQLGRAPGQVAGWRLNPSVWSTDSRGAVDLCSFDLRQG